MFRKKSKDKVQSSGGGAYPKQSPYPTQPAYPVQQPSGPPPGYPGYQPGQQGYPPPPGQLGYPPQPGQPPQPGYPPPPGQLGYPPQPGQPPQQGYPPPPGQLGYPPQPGQPPQPPPYSQQPPQHTEIAPTAVFNQDAAIDPNGTINIPPPPPGYAPTAAQQAFAEGRSVQVDRQKKDIWGGGSDGGVSIW